MAALESAVADRNVLSGQNTQLWKLIEKQRAGYSQILKEIERIRGERDAYRHRLHVLGESTEAVLKAHKERERREGKDASVKSATSQAQIRHSESSGSVDPRQHTSRAHSNNICESPIVARSFFAGISPSVSWSKDLTACIASSLS